MSESAGRVKAWMTDDGRVISELQKAGAIKDGGASKSSVAPYTEALVPEQLLVEAEARLDRDREFIRKLDGIIEEVGGVTASCINPYEDLKRALIGQKQRAESAEPKLALVRALADEWLIHAEEHDAEAKDAKSDFYYAQKTTRAHECRQKALQIRALTETPSEETR